MKMAPPTSARQRVNLQRFRRRKYLNHYSPTIGDLDVGADDVEDEQTAPF